MGCLRPSFTPAGDPSTPRPHAFCPAPAALLRPTLSAWASRDFKLLVTIFSSSSRSPHLLHPKQGPPGEGAGPGGKERGGAERAVVGKEERKRENKLREGKTAQVEKEQSYCEQELLGRIRSSIPRASLHGHPVHHCQPAPPRRRAGMVGWRSVPSLRPPEGEARGGRQWRQWCREERGGSHGLRDSDRERGAAAHRPVPLPQYLFL